MHVNSVEEMPAPKVTVLVPTYNTEKYLAQNLDALVEQTLRDIEIIAINDGSTDGSLDIMRQYAAHDARIRIINKPNSGYGASLNLGIDEARGEYIAISEPDDYIERTMLAKMYKGRSAKPIWLNATISSISTLTRTSIRILPAIRTAGCSMRLISRRSSEPSPASGRVCIAVTGLTPKASASAKRQVRPSRTPRSS